MRLIHMNMVVLVKKYVSQKRLGTTELGWNQLKCCFSSLDIDWNTCVVAYLHVRISKPSLWRMRGFSDGRIFGNLSLSEWPVENTHTHTHTHIVGISRALCMWVRFVLTSFCLLCKSFSAVKALGVFPVLGGQVVEMSSGLRWADRKEERRLDRGRKATIYGAAVPVCQ